MRIIIAIREFDCGGTEIAMLNLLKRLVAASHDITLLVAGKRGEYLGMVPDSVRILEIPFKNGENRFFISDDVSLLKNPKHKPLYKIIRKCIRGLDKGLKKVNYKIDIYNKWVLSLASPLEESYDLAIDFYGYGCFQSKYVAKYVNAPRKIMWIHDEKLDPISRARSEFPDYQYFFGVSKACADAFTKAFPETRNRVGVFWNILDTDNIMKKSKEGIEESSFGSKYTIVSVGRLEKQKGFDMAIDAAYQLKKKGRVFDWYIIGEGSWHERLSGQIQKLGLEKEVHLLGRKNNPYPYIAACDLYVQSSRHEGYGLTIAEARILEKPIISTKLSCVEEQLVDGVTGVLVPFDSVMLANAMESLMDDEQLGKELVNNLKLQNKEKDYSLDQINRMLMGPEKTDQ